MSRLARRAGITAAVVVVIAWAWWHGRTNGASLAVIGLILALAGWMTWRHFRTPNLDRPDPWWADPRRHRGDAL